MVNALASSSMPRVIAHHRPAIGGLPASVCIGVILRIEPAVVFQTMNFVWRRMPPDMSFGVQQCLSNMP